MTLLPYFFVAYFSVLLCYLVVLLILFNTAKKDKSAQHYSTKDYPFISILVAARNEEYTITNCLNALDKLDWPKDKLEILVGNDQSTDTTASVVRQYSDNKPYIRLIDITTQVGSTKGKANVLAQLAQSAKGEFFFITDADIQVPEQWIQSLLANYNPTIGIVSGATTVKAKTLFDYCQKMDWVYAFGMVKTVSDISIPVSAVGNNMMISKQAYLTTGGYENIPFSITEDLQLFIETRKKGWNYKNLLSPDCIGMTNPIADLKTLLQQRKRWMQGAAQLPVILVLFLVLQALFVPIMITTLLYFHTAGLLLWLSKIVVQQLFLWCAFKQTGENYSILKNFILFELYTGILSVIVLVNYFIPTKINWKGRQY